MTRHAWFQRRRNWSGFSGRWPRRESMVSTARRDDSGSLNSRGSDPNLAGWTKKITGQTDSYGGIGQSGRGFHGFAWQNPGTCRRIRWPSRDFDRLLEMLARGDFDLVAVGRATLADWGWAEKVYQGRFEELVLFTLAC